MRLVNILCVLTVLLTRLRSIRSGMRISYTNTRVADGLGKSVSIINIDSREFIVRVSDDQGNIKWNTQPGTRTYDIPAGRGLSGYPNNPRLRHLSHHRSHMPKMPEMPERPAMPRMYRQTTYSPGMRKSGISKRSANSPRPKKKTYDTYPGGIPSDFPLKHKPSNSMKSKQLAQEGVYNKVEYIPIKIKGKKKSKSHSVKRRDLLVPDVYGPRDSFERTRYRNDDDYFEPQRRGNIIVNVVN